MNFRLGILLAGIALGAFFAGRFSVARTRLASDPDHGLSPTAASPRVVPAADAGERSSPTAPELASTVARIHQHAANLAAEEERQRLIEQWAERDPAAAIDFALTQLRGDRRAQAVAAILTIWGRNQPESAWNWVATTLPDAIHHFDTLLEVFGRSSPSLAARYAAQLARERPGIAVEVHLAALLGVTHQGKFDAARQLIDGNAALSGEERAVLNNFLAGQWARYQPQEAAAWVDTLPPGRARDLAIVGLGESWSEVDPAGAARYAAKLPPGELRQTALRQAITKWVLEDAPKVNEWIVQNPPHEDFDQAIAAMATGQEFTERYLGLALSWADTIYNEDLRTRSIAQIISNWSAHDPVAASNYLRTAANLPAAQRDQLLQQIQPTP